MQDTITHLQVGHSKASCAFFELMHTDLYVRVCVCLSVSTSLDLCDCVCLPQLKFASCVSLQYALAEVDGTRATKRGKRR